MNTQARPRHGVGEEKTGFGFLWATTGVTTFGDAVTSIALPLVAVLVFNASALVVAALIAVEQASWLFLGLLVGVWTDRTRARRLIQVSYAVRAVAIGSVPVAYVAGQLTLTHVFVAAATASMAEVFSSVGQLALVPKIVNKGRLVAANARLSATTTSTSLAGQGAGGVLVGAVTAPLALLVEAVSSLISVFLLRAVPDAAPVNAGNDVRLRHQLLAGVRYTLVHPLFRIVTFSGAVVNGLAAAQYALIFVFLARTLDVPPAWVGVLIATGGVGGVVGAAVANRLSVRFGTGRVWRMALLLGPMVGLALPVAWPGIGLVFFVIGNVGIAIGTAIVAVIGGSARQAACPPDLIGRMSATSRTLTWGVIPLGAAAGGALSAIVGVRGALWLVAVAFFLAPLMVWLSPVRRVHDLASAEEELNRFTPAG
jgi:MFS family permease